MRIFGAAFLLSFAFSFPVLAQSADKVVEQFKMIHRAQDDAEARKDIGALDKMFADDFMFIAANGAAYDKKKFLEDIKADTSPPPVETLEYEDFKVRTYGKTAIVNYVLVVRGKDKEAKATTSRFRMSVLWVKNGKDWRTSNFHATRIRP